MLFSMLSILDYISFSSFFSLAVIPPPFLLTSAQGRMVGYISNRQIEQLEKNKIDRKYVLQKDRIGAADRIDRIERMHRTDSIFYRQSGMYRVF